jgi:hypothetical protein
VANVPASKAACPLPAADPGGHPGETDDAQAGRAVMYAHVSDRLIAEGDAARSGLIISVPHEDGSPPYIVKWLSDGHIAMVWPGDFARVAPAGRPQPDARRPGQQRPLVPGLQDRCLRCGTLPGWQARIRSWRGAASGWGHVCARDMSRTSAPHQGRNLSPSAGDRRDYGPALARTAAARVEVTGPVERRSR